MCIKQLSPGRRWAQSAMHSMLPCHKWDEWYSVVMQQQLGLGSPIIGANRRRYSVMAQQEMELGLLAQQQQQRVSTCVQGNVLAAAVCSRLSWGCPGGHAPGHVGRLHGDDSKLVHLQPRDFDMLCHCLQIAGHSCSLKKTSWALPCNGLCCCWLGTRTKCVRDCFMFRLNGLWQDSRL